MKYKKSHPWIDFRLDLSKLHFAFWMNLGAIQSKCKHIANVLLPPNITQQLNQLSLIKGVQATTAIEGNTLTEDQVRDIIKGQAKIPKSKDYQRIEVENVVSACNQVTEQALKDKQDTVTFEDICAYNRMILHHLELERDVVAGEIPRQNIVVGGYRGAPRDECEYLVRRLCTWINDELKPPSDDMLVAFAVMRAVLFHLYFVWIHPFGDGNGRTARLVELKILLSAGLPAPAAHLLSNHYNQTRTEYYRRLDRSHKTSDGVGAFLAYAMQGLVDGLDEQIRAINNYQFHVSWKDFVYGKFHEKKTIAAMRQRQIALDLFDNYPDGIEKSRIRKMTPAVAVLFGQKSPITVTRDLNSLGEMGLIEFDKSIVRANFHSMSSLFPQQLGVLLA